MEKITTDAIKSIIIGIGISIFIGFVFSNTSYFYDAVEISEKVYKENIGNIDVFKRIIKKEEFNYKAGLISGSLSLLFFMFVFYDKHRKIVFQNKSKIFFEILIKKTHYILSGFSLKGIKKNSSYVYKNLIFSLKGIKEDTSYLFKNVIFNFNGRISRSAFFGEILALNLVGYFILNLHQQEKNLFFAIIFLIIYLFFLVKINVRRLHDFNVSGWYSIVTIIPGFSLILLFIPGNSYANTYGEKPN